GPASSMRCEIGRRCHDIDPGLPAPARDDPPPPKDSARPHASRVPGAELLLRVFCEDMLLCPCGGRRVVLAFITEKKVVKEILEHLGLPSTGPPVAPTRITAASEETPWQDDVPAAANAALTGSPMPIS